MVKILIMAALVAASIFAYDCNGDGKDVKVKTVVPNMGDLDQIYQNPGKNGCKGYKYYVMGADKKTLACSNIVIDPAFLVQCEKKNFSDKVCGVFYGNKTVSLLEAK